MLIMKKSSCKIACLHLRITNVLSEAMLLISFRECESFENLYPTRLDEIIREAKELEQQLKLQKESLKERLRFLTRTLASTPPDSE